MVHRVTLFPLNVTGLLLGIVATATIAVSGAYSHTLWPLGADATLALRASGWALAAFLFFFLLYRARAGVVISLRAVLLSSVLLCVPLMLTQPAFAGDLYAYVAGAKVAAIGNPYVLTPSVLGTDVILNGVAPVWRGQPSAYGPLWNLMASGLGHLTTNAFALLTSFRLLALAGVLTCAWLIAKATSPMHAALIALNPIVLVDAVADGHHDILVGLGVLAAVAWFRRPARSALALAGATAFKFVPLIVAPVLIASGAPGKRRVLGAWFALAVVSLLVVSFMPFWVGAPTFDGLRQQASLFSQPVFFPQFLIFIFAYLGGSAVHPEVLARGLGLFAFLVAYAWTFLAAWRQRISPVAAVAIVLASYIFLAAPYVQTWYLLWLLPVLALLPTRQAVRWVGATSVAWGTMLLVTSLHTVQIHW
ncbi:MAG: hypothetical protein Q8O51_01320 [bacterium]|nr:hypothetical protein [bacterium]